MSAIETSVDEWIIGPAYLVFAVVNITIICVHSRNVYLDLHTAERKCLSHKRALPPITKQYKMMTWLTLVTVIAFGLTTILSNYTHNFAFIQSESLCATLTPIVILPFQLSKPFMYLVFILRLHQVYSQSAYGYKLSTLYCLAITITTLYVVHGIITSITTVNQGEFIGDADDQYPFHCFVYAPLELRPIIGGIQVLLDLVLGIGAIITFQVPINRLIKRIQDQNETDHLSKQQQKMLYIGYKYKVLVGCATTTSIIWILIAMFGQQTATNVIAALDFTVNMICLMLMTPYYPDNIYYQRLCKICICCYDRKGQSYESKATREARELEAKRMENEETVSVTKTKESGKTNTLSPTSIATPSVPTVPTVISTPVSVDTMDQIEVIAKETNPDHLLTSGSEYDDGEVP